MKRLRKSIAVITAAILMMTASISPHAAVIRVQGSHFQNIVCQQNDCDRYEKLCQLFSRFGGKCALSICSAQKAAPPVTQKQTEAPTEPKTEPPVQPATQAPTSAAVPSDNAGALSAYEQEVVTLTNRYRVQNGLKPLTTDASLSRVARLKSEDMRAKGYFDHTSPTYGTPFEMMKRFGIAYRTAGENIAMGYRTPQSVVDGWMNSPGHRANILNASFTKISVGHVANGNYWTQMFIG